MHLGNLKVLELLSLDPLNEGTHIKILNDKFLEELKNKIA